MYFTTDVWSVYTQPSDIDITEAIGQMTKHSTAWRVYIKQNGQEIPNPTLNLFLREKFIKAGSRDPAGGIPWKGTNKTALSKRISTELGK